jgi:acyl-CoA thioesterase
MSDGPPGAFADNIGLTITDVEPGYSRGELTVTDDLYNPNHVLHGAVTYAMADTGMGAALQHSLDDGEACATVEIKISYMEPVRDGSLVCETTVTRRGNSIAYLESDVRQGETLVARATGTFSIFSP